MSPEKAQQWVAKYKKAKTKKDRWNQLWQYCGEYIHGKKQNFTEFTDEGTFLNTDVFDSTAPKAARKMAASMIGLLWHSGGKSVRMNPVRSLPKTKEVKDYFDFVSEELAEALDDPRAGLALALEEYMVDQSAFGTSGIGVFKEETGDDNDLRFQCWGVDEITIEEGGNGYVRTIFREYEVTILQAAEDYGLENLSDACRDKFKEGQSSDKVRFLHVIAPRSNVDPEKDGNKAMAFMSLTLELKSKHVVKESGFEEMPVPISRFYKRNNEVYGRSPGMDALPDILEINATKEARISAIEKSLDPPLGIYDDSVLGNEEVDTSAGGINVFATSSRIGQRQPIFPLFTVETIREADKSIEELKESINEHFNIDRLLDFNNQTAMTLGEAQMRDRIRSQSLGALFNRQVAELFTPMIERAVAILHRNGKLGVIKGSELQQKLELQNEDMKVIPDDVAKLIQEGKNFYDLKYLTPAARMMETAEASGVVQAWEFAGMIGQFNPEAFDSLDPDKSLEIVGKTAGAPSSIYKDEETVINMRKARAEAQANQQKLEQLKAGGDAMGALGQGGEALKSISGQDEQQ